jgi:hypothetical protein
VASLRDGLLLAHFIGGLRRPLAIGSVTYTWPLIGLYVYADRFEFGPGFRFMRRLSRPVRVFHASEVDIVGPTNNGVRFTFKDGERWLFTQCNMPAVLKAIADLGVTVTSTVEPARWMPPL